jgi:hypothetical protein
LNGRSNATIAAIVAIAIGVAGCGGGGDDGSEISTSSLSKAEFTRKAEAICVKGQKQVERNFGAFAKKTDFNLRQVSQNPTKAQVNGLVNSVLIPAIKQEIAAIRALGAPQGDEDQIEAMLEANEEGIATAEDLPREVLEKTEVAFGVASRLAKEYGLALCGQR